jgi:hypothetical protein
VLHGTPNMHMCQMGLWHSTLHASRPHHHTQIRITFAGNSCCIPASCPVLNSKYLYTQRMVMQHTLHVANSGSIRVL